MGSNRLSRSIGVDLSTQIYERTLYQPYSIHVSRNSSEILSGLNKSINLVNSLIQPLLTFVGASLMLISIMSIMIWVDPFTAIISFICFGLLYLLIVFITRERVTRNSMVMSQRQNTNTKVVQEGLGAIRDILIDGTQHIYVRVYQNSLRPYMKALSENQVIGSSPRIIMESVGIVFIAGLALTLSKNRGGITNSIPLIGILALGAQRLLPVMQQLYSSWIVLKGYQSSSRDVLNLLDQPIRKNDRSKVSLFDFKDQITLQNVNFQYSDNTPLILNDINLSIKKGSRIGIMGITGSGKSTLIDIIMGLLSPTKGEILVDGILINENNLKSWQANISHVPQNIFLSDSTISENIAFGVPSKDINIDLVRKSAYLAKISTSIENWTHGYSTKVGERGIRLSGGQRQRIGIARAFYKKSKFIILDEATSALDIQTESEVMKSIESIGNDTTVIIITHRLSTLNNCTEVYELVNGKLIVRNIEIQ